MCEMLMLKNTKKIAMLGLAMFAGGSSAQAQDHLACKSTGHFSWGCQVAQAEVSLPLTFRGESVGTSYKLEYKLDCPGHNMNLRLRAGQEDVVLNQSSAVDLAVVEGDASVQLVDSDPDRTRRLIFRGDCQLEVVNVAKSPSAGAREAWGQSALAQAKTLRHVQSLYLLATDYEELSSWNQTRLQQVRDRLEKLVERFPRVVHYKVLLRSVKSALEGAPTPHSPQEVADAANSLAQEYRDALESELSVARHMAERFQHFKLAIQEDLQDALNEVAEVRQ